MIRARIHKHGDERLLAACDEELLGLTFSEGVVKVTISENFYGADTMTEETLGERMGSVTIMNLFGDRSIAVGIEKGFVTPENVITVAGIKHAQVVLL